MSTIIKMLLKEMEQEAQTTRKMLERIPNDKYQWQPHPKSMTVKSLATHIAELPAWVSMTLNTDGLDFAANPYAPADINDTTALLQLYETSLAEGKMRLEEATEDELSKPWTLSNAGHILFEATKGETIRMAFSQIVHHRAQLGVDLRLLNIPIPGSYGPSADEH